MVVGKSFDAGIKLSSDGKEQSLEPLQIKELVQSPALNLLIMTQFFPPDFAATGQLIEELVTQLGQQDVNVKVFTGQPGYAFAEGEAPRVEQKGNVCVKRSRMSQLFSNRIRGKALNGVMFALRAVFHSIRHAKKHNVLLVTTAPPFLPIIGYLVNLLLGMPYVCLLYDLYPDIAVELKVVKSSHSLVRLWHWLNCQVWRRSSSIIVLSSSMKKRIVAHCPEIAEKIEIIHSWSDDQKIVPIPKEENWFAKEHELTENFVVLYSGNMGRCHDINTLFEVACHLKDESILFICIGGGAKREDLMSQVNARKLKNFRFLPYQEKSILPYSLTSGDVSLVSIAPGMDSLVAPSKLYPAMATGRPIVAICPDSSYLVPLLSSAKCGTAFKNGESQAIATYILELSRDIAKAQQLGKAGRQYLETHFTPEVISKQYLRVVQKVAS